MGARLIILSIFAASCSSAVPVGPCIDEQCSGHGECIVDDDGMASCACDDGYESQGLECLPAHPPADADGDGDADSDGDTDGDGDADGDSEGSVDGDLMPDCVGEGFTEGMVLVPEGPFWMGCDPDIHPCVGEPDYRYFPYHEVYLDAFEIDVTEVTVEQYRVCYEAGACDRPSRDFEEYSNWFEPDRARHPVNFVDWDDARSYCEFHDKRLCTEAEWEKAARGTDHRFYPWGDELAGCEYAVLNHEDGSGFGCGTDATMEMGSKPLDCSPYGALDMMGNLSEWVHDRYGEHYYSESPYANPQGPDCCVRVTRGASAFVGSIELSAIWVNVVMRWPYESDNHFRDLGFRCCRSVQ